MHSPSTSANLAQHITPRTMRTHCIATKIRTPGTDLQSVGRRPAEMSMSAEAVAWGDTDYVVADM
jgi:hypothetical protein